MRLPDDYDSIANMTNIQAAEVLENMVVRMMGGRANGKTILMLCYNKALEKAIKSLKEERPQGEWISLSEKQPQKSGYYITSTIYNQVYCDYWSVNHFERTETVLAWMPLPEPYKTGGEQNEDS